MANPSSKVGKIFENDFYKSCPEDMILVRLKDGKGYGKNPCDYILLSKDKGIMLELKTTKEKRLPKANIREHQLEILGAVAQMGIPAYFVINFREYDETYAIRADIIKKEFETGIKSIPIKWFRDNYKPIKQYKKRTRWRYEYGNSSFDDRSII